MRNYQLYIKKINYEELIYRREADADKKIKDKKF